MNFRMFCLFDLFCYVLFRNRIGGVMVNILALSVIDRGFELECDRSWVRAPVRSNQKLQNCISCCFSVTYTTLREKSKDCFVRNQDNVTACSDMPIAD